MSSATVLGSRNSTAARSERIISARLLQAIHGPEQAQRPRRCALGRNCGQTAIRPISPAIGSLRFFSYASPGKLEDRFRMYRAVTRQIVVTVEPNFMPERSVGEYFWSYTIVIINAGAETVQLK